MSWKIVYYKTPRGKDVIKDFLDELQENTQAKVGRQLDLLEKYGFALRMPYVKAFGNGLMELRVRGNQEVRIFYTFIREGKICLLHGFIKKSQATPTRELVIARKRQSKVKNT